MKNTNKNFRSSMVYPSKEVKIVLNNKIREEKEEALNNTTYENKRFEEKLYNKIKYDKNKINIVSLFSGAGGLDLGTEMSSISAKYGYKAAYKNILDRSKFERLNNITNIVYSNDNFKEANETFKNNFSGQYVKDERNIKKVISFPKSDLMLGGFPCPGFSVAGPRLIDDPRNFLYIHYIRALIDSQPYFFVAENVKGLMTMANGDVLNQIIEDFSAAGYQVSANLVNSKYYGVPQSRERVFIVGIRNDIVEQYGFKYELPKKTNGDNTENKLVTLKDAIYDLPKKPDDVFEGSYSMIYMSRNRKKSWEDQSFTIQASGRQAPQYPGGEPMTKVGKNHWKFNGDTNRRLSARECARIQTFPDWFKFYDGSENKNIKKSGRLNKQYKQIGNAVPVYLAEKMLRPILKFLMDKKGIK